MTLSLRRRVALLFLPPAAFLFGIGLAGVGLLDNLGRRADDIIRENVVSLRAMFALQRSLADMERIAISAARERDPLHPDVSRGFRAAAARAREACAAEVANVTVPGEREEAEALNRALELAIARGEELLAAPAARRWELYTAPGTGFQAAATTTWQHLVSIWELNEGAVSAADRAARDTARRSTVALAGAVTVGVLLTVAFGWWLWRVLIGPLRAVTDAAVAVGSGNLELVVPGGGDDELGRLAGAFNDMARKLRAYRQTNTERLLRARETARAAIDSFPDPVLVLDTLGRVESANPAAQRVLGATAPRDDEAGAPWVPPEPLAPVRAALAAGASLATSTFDEAVTFHAGGEDRSYLPQVRPIRAPDGAPLGAAVVLNDVTRFRLLDRLKSDWVATVSHELKTPLTSVRLAVHVLLEEVVGPLEPKQVELLLEARASAERLLALIEQLLALAKLEEGREELTPRPTAPAALLRSAADEAAARAADRHVALTVTAAPDLPRVAVDPERFARALRNLIDNALAHTDAGGSVDLRASAGDNAVSLEVRDTGVGIPAEHLPHVFERFFRVPGRADRPGTGLGLAIVREIVAAHGGTVACASAEGAGTTFRILLPAEGGE